MGRLWNSNAEVDRAANTLKNAYTTNGDIPPEMVRAYRETMERASHGQVMRFFDNITESCPELLKFFPSETTEEKAQHAV